MNSNSVYFDVESVLNQTKRILRMQGRDEATAPLFFRTLLVFFALRINRGFRNFGKLFVRRFFLV